MSLQRVLWLPLGVLALLAGCQRYQPDPLDLSRHDVVLRQRDPAAGEVSAYAQRLATLGYRPAGRYDPSDGLSLPEAEVVALFFNPQLRLARLKARVPAAGAREAGRWEDPELSVDAERILTSVDKPWVLGGMLSFTIPLSGRLGAEKQRALAEADAELLRAWGQEVQLLSELRAKWLEWSARQQQIELTGKYVTELDEVLVRAEKLRAAGELDQLDARLFRIERVTRLGQLKVLELEQREATVTLKGLMGLAPAAPARLLPTLSLPDIAPPATQPTSVLEHHPRLRLAKAEYEVAERTLAAEVRKQYPDVTLGAGPGTEEGDTRILVGLSLPLPFLNANRRGIAEARVTRDASRAAAETTYEELVGELERFTIALETAQARQQFLQAELTPLVDQQLADAKKLARLGEFQTLISLEAYTKAYETKLEVLEATLKQALAANQLHTLLSAGNPPVVEMKQ